MLIYKCNVCVSKIKMLRLRYILYKINTMDQNIIIPIFGMLTGIIIPIAVFIWQYYEGKGKRETVLEISKNLNDPAKVEELLSIFDERKKEPIDYRRGGIITLFVGIGISLLGFVAMGSFFKALDT